MPGLADAKQARRILAIAIALDGHSRLFTATPVSRSTCAI
jgi:hypothetical protein